MAGLDQILPIVAAALTVGFLGYVFYYYFLRDRFLRKKGLLVRLLIHERVGDDYVYKGESVGEEVQDDKLGHYIKIRGTKVGLERLSNADFIQDKTYDKCLAIVKYAQDDYRPMIRLKGSGNWFRREKKQVTETYDVPDPDNPAQLMKIEQPKYDDKGQPVMQDFEVEYEEPMGIGKDDRAAMRFNLDYAKRMEERFGEKKGLMSMLMQIAVPLAAMILLLGGLMHFNDKDIERSEMFYREVDMESARVIENIQKNPSFVQGLINKVEQKQKEEDAPPR